jgi:hypothetical protein
MTVLLHWFMLHLVLGRSGNAQPSLSPKLFQRCVGIQNFRDILL